MKDTMDRVNEHITEVKKMFADDRIVGIFLQGSQNYKLDIYGSDIDTKCVLVPSFYDLAMNKKPLSTTHIRENDEHIDLKDIRLMIQTFRKQNINFIEILFTPYFAITPCYFFEWVRLQKAREDIARLNPHAAVKTMCGMAREKFFAMEHKYPSKAEIIENYGYDCKQLHHICRLKEFMSRYIAGESYADCLISRNIDYLKAIKANYFNLEQARIVATKAMKTITTMANDFCETCPSQENQATVELLEDVQLNIMRIAIERELNHV